MKRCCAKTSVTHRAFVCLKTTSVIFLGSDRIFVLSAMAGSEHFLHHHLRAAQPIHNDRETSLALGRILQRIEDILEVSEKVNDTTAELQEAQERLELKLQQLASDVRHVQQVQERLEQLAVEIQEDVGNSYRAIFESVQIAPEAHPRLEEHIQRIANTLQTIEQTCDRIEARVINLNSLD